MHRRPSPPADGRPSNAQENPRARAGLQVNHLPHALSAIAQLHEGISQLRDLLQQCSQEDIAVLQPNLKNIRQHMLSDVQLLDAPLQGYLAKAAITKEVALKKRQAAEEAIAAKKVAETELLNMMQRKTRDEIPKWAKLNDKGVGPICEFFEERVAIARAKADQLHLDMLTSKEAWKKSHLAAVKQVVPGMLKSDMYFQRARDGIANGEMAILNDTMAAVHEISVMVNKATHPEAADSGDDETVCEQTIPEGIARDSMEYLERLLGDANEANHTHIEQGFGLGLQQFAHSQDAGIAVTTIWGQVKEEAMREAWHKHNGDYSKLVDIAGARIVADDVNSLIVCMQYISHQVGEGGLNLVKVENGWQPVGDSEEEVSANILRGSHRHITLHVKFPGMDLVCGLHFHLKAYDAVIENEMDEMQVLFDQACDLKVFDPFYLQAARYASFGVPTFRRILDLNNKEAEKKMTRKLTTIKRRLSQRLSVSTLGEVVAQQDSNGNSTDKNSNQTEENGQVAAAAAAATADGGSGNGGGRHPATVLAPESHWLNEQDARFDATLVVIDCARVDMAAARHTVNALCSPLNPFHSVRLERFSVRNPPHRFLLRAFACNHTLHSLSLADNNDIDDDTVKLCASVYLKRLDLAGCCTVTDAAARVVGGCLSLESLRLAGCRSVTDAGVNAIAAGCKELCHVDLSGADQITDHALYDISACCTHLAGIELQGTKVTRRGMKSLLDARGKALTNFAPLCSETDDEVIGAAAVAATRLRRVGLEDCDEVGASAIVSLVSANPRLHTLGLGGCALFTNASLETVIAHCPHLEDLCLAGCSLVSDAGMRALADSPAARRHLRHLDVFSCWKVTDTGGVALAQLAALRRLHVGNTKVADAGVCAIAAACADLSALDLSRTRVTDKALAAVGAHCQQLEELRVAGAYTGQVKVTDEGLKAVAALPRLAMVSFHSCNVGDTGVSALAAAAARARESRAAERAGELSPRMASRSLAGGVPGTDDGGDDDDGTGLLVHVDLGDTQVTDAGVDALTQECKALEHLGLLHTDVTQAGLRFVSDRCPRLRHLDLSDCFDVDDVALGHVARGNKEMRRLVLVHCHKVTEAGVARILDRCPRLQKLELMCGDDGDAADDGAGKNGPQVRVHVVKELEKKFPTVEIVHRFEQLENEELVFD